MFILPFTYRNPNLATCYLTLLQLSEDISLNPGPSPSPINNVRMAKINIRSISKEIASFYDIVE